MLKPYWKPHKVLRYIGTIRVETDNYDMYCNDSVLNGIVIKWGNTDDAQYVYYEGRDTTALIDPIVKEVIKFAIAVKDKVIQYGS